MTDTATDLEHGADEAHDHPSDWEYIKIAIILGILTAIEVAMFFLEDTLNRPILFIGLSVLMIIKFFLVVAWFMHLRFDNALFWKVFTFGLTLAVAVYFIMFFAFDLFGLG